MQRKIKKGQKIFSQNDKSKEMYYIQSGEVSIHQLKNKKEVHLATLQKGALFGEMAIIAGMHRTATAVASEDAELNVITEDDFKSSTSDVPSWYMTLLRITCERLQQINERLQVSGSRTITISNIARLLVMILKKNQRDKKEEPDSGQNLSQLDLRAVKQELIEILGIGVPALDDALTFLTEKEMIAILPNIIEIPDPVTLNHYCKFLKRNANTQDFELIPEELFSLLMNLNDLLTKENKNAQIASCTYAEFKSDMADKILLEEEKIEWFLTVCQKNGIIKFIFSNTTETANIDKLDDQAQLQFQLLKLAETVNEEKFKSLGT